MALECSCGALLALAAAGWALALSALILLVGSRRGARPAGAPPAAATTDPHKPTQQMGAPSAAATTTTTTAAAATAAAAVDPYDSKPRSAFLSWDDYFMAVAFLSAQRSKDPSKQVGACIVNDEHIIVSIGYNGFPRGCHDRALPWAKKAPSGSLLDTKYPYVVHAEANALLNTNAAKVAGTRVYVTLFPCNECAKLLIQAGIKEVVFHEAKFDLGLLQGGDHHHHHHQLLAAAPQPAAAGADALACSSDGSPGRCSGGGCPGCCSGGSGVPSAPSSSAVQPPGPPCQQLLQRRGGRDAAAGAAAAAAAAESGGSDDARAPDQQGVSGGAGVQQQHHRHPARQPGPSGAAAHAAAKAPPRPVVDADQEMYLASLRLLQMAGVQLRQHQISRMVVVGG